MGKRSREKRERMLQTEGRSETLVKKRSGLERVYFLIIEWGTYLALFTPLILVRSFFFPFVSPKTIFFRIVVEIIFVAYVLLVLSNHKYLPKFNALTIAVTVFLGITILTSFTGINFEKSFWSVFERMTGLLTFFHLYVFFIILISVFREKRYWERILSVSILVGVFASIYAIFNSEASTRSGGTFGNISFMAAYLLFDVFFAIALLMVKRGGWRIFYAVSSIIMLSSLFLTPERPRGGILSFFIGLFLLGLGYMFFSGRPLFKKLAPIILISLVLIGIGFSQTAFFKATMFDIKELPGSARKIVWQMGFESWKAKFWLGWGPENFNIAFVKYFDPKVAATGDLWYDRVHNVVLDTAVNSGILGLLSYLSIFGIAVIGLLKLCSKITEKRTLFFPLGMLVILMVYFAQNIWVFDMISSYMIFFLSLAFISFLMSPKEEYLQIAPSREKNTLQSLTGACLIIITIFTLYFGNIRPALASRYIIQGITLNLENSITAFQKALQTSPISIFEAPEQFSRKITGIAFDPGQNRETLIKGFNLAAEDVKKAIEKNPQDFRFYLVLGKHYNDFFQLTQDEKKLELADFYLKEALEISPQNQQAYWSLAQTRLFQGKEGEAVDLMLKSVALDPQFSNSHWYLALTYKVLGQNELALAQVQESEKTGRSWKANLEDIKKVIGIYQSLQDDEHLVELYLKGIDMDPTNAQFRAALAVSYANLGQFDKARQYAKEALSLNPDFAAELEEFLKQLPK